MLPRPRPTPTPREIWTRVADDTGGGASASNFETLYFEGDSVLAAAAMLHGLGVKSDAGTPEYGPALSFKEGSSLAELSWHERGCAYDQARRAPTEAPSGVAWRPYFPLDAWIQSCERDLDRAVEHAASNNSRHGARLHCPRAATLALALRRPGGASFSSICAERRASDSERWARELLELALGPAGAELPPMAASSCATALGVACYGARMRLYSSASSAAWANLGEDLEGSDFERVGELAPDAAQGAAAKLSALAALGQRLADFPDGGRALLSTVGADFLADLAAFPRKMGILPHSAAVASAIEARALELASNPAASASRAGPRL